MGAHPEHAYHKAFHTWRSRAKHAEAKLERIEAVLVAAERGSQTFGALSDIEKIVRENDQH